MSSFLSFRYSHGGCHYHHIPDVFPSHARGSALSKKSRKGGMRWTDPLISKINVKNSYGTSWASHLVMMCGYIVFYMINWRARHEGVMNFGIFSVTEAQYMGMGIYAATGFWGCDTWRVRFPMLGNMSSRSLIAIFAVCGAIATCIIEYREVR